MSSVFIQTFTVAIDGPPHKELSCVQMKKIINPRTAILTTIIILAATWRVLISSGDSELANFTPVGAIALFAGCYFANKTKAYLVPLLALFISDVLLNYFFYYNEIKIFHDDFFWTYLSFAIIVAAGSLIKKVSINSVTMASISAALIHWVISDFGVWVQGLLYPKTFEGLVQCYIAAIPFLRSMLVSNIIFAVIMFGLFELAQSRISFLQVRQPA